MPHLIRARSASECVLSGFTRSRFSSPVELSGLIKVVVDQVRPFIHARQLHLHLAVAEDLGTFEIDADKISAVLVNLMTNAIKFTPDQGEIELCAELDESEDVPEFSSPTVGSVSSPGAQTPIPAFLHPVRSQPTFLGRLWILASAASAWG